MEKDSRKNYETNQCIWCDCSLRNLWLRSPAEFLRLKMSLFARWCNFEERKVIEVRYVLIINEHQGSGLAMEVKPPLQWLQHQSMWSIWLSHLLRNGVLISVTCPASQTKSATKQPRVLKTLNFFLSTLQLAHSAKSSAKANINCHIRCKASYSLHRLVHMGVCREGVLIVSSRHVRTCHKGMRSDNAGKCSHHLLAVPRDKVQDLYSACSRELISRTDTALRFLLMLLWPSSLSWVDVIACRPCLPIRPNHQRTQGNKMLQTSDLLSKPSCLLSNEILESLRALLRKIMFMLSKLWFRFIFKILLWPKI